MTLKKTSRKPPAYHHKISGNHHRRSKRYHQTYWPYLPLLLIVFGGLLLNSGLNHKHGVLSYSTDMSIQELLDDTNSQRGANGLGGLSLNAQLDSAAQSKAQDMANRDYWSHNTPDNQTPWTFMTAAGYNYQFAGENLAYGFTTAADTLTGWMNSPGHRANILNTDYREVGFGFINIANYQNNGPETLVVAMYGAQQTEAAVSPPVVPTPSSGTSKPASASGGSSSSVNKDGGAANPANNTTDTQASSPTPTGSSTDIVVSTDLSKNAKQSKEPAPQQVARIQLLTAGNASWSLLATTLIGIGGLLFFLLRHGLAWHKIFIKGERYLLKHPLLDIALVALIALSFVLTRSTGIIR